MKRTFSINLIILFTLLLLVSSCDTNKKGGEEANSNRDSLTEAVTKDSPAFFELRTYYAAEGKLEALLSRFRDHTQSLFAKQGMTNIGYWVPVENKDNKLVYILGYKSKEHREKAWKAFLDDPDWKKAFKASRKNGALVDSIKNIFLHKTPFSPEINLADKATRIFELRTYYTNEGKLMDLHKRFSDHTLALFEKWGMTNFVYFELEEDQVGAENTLVYLLAHNSVEAAEESWKNFRDDPVWKEAFEASRQDGALVNEVVSEFLKPTDFSPVK